MNGWIKIHKKFLNWGWYNDTNMVRLFLHLLLTANYEEKEWKGQIIKRGQTIVGRMELSKILSISEQTIRTCITKLKSTNEITTKSTNKYTIITLVKYEEYQKVDKKLTNKSTNKLTNDQPTTNQQLTTPKEIKNKRNKEYIKASADAEEFNFQLKVNNMLLSEDKRMPIISNYWSYKGITFTNKEQYSAGIKRELRPAKNLIGYDLERIKEVMYFLNGTGIDWTLETTHKYIDKDLTQIKINL